MALMGEKIRGLATRLLGERNLLELRRYYQSYNLTHGRYKLHPAELAFLKRHIPSGGTAIDIGANIGVYTRVFSDLVGQSGIIWAFEPVSTTYRSLVYNVERFPNQNVVTFHAAVTSTFGLTRVVLPTSGFQGFYRARIGIEPNAEQHSMTVQKLTLDCLLDEAPAVDFVKCDVEGVELYVLEGAKQLLTRDWPVILIEVQDHTRTFNYPPTRIFDLLGEWGWSGHYFSGSKLVETDRPVDNNIGPNYAFIPRHRVQSLKR